jgi:hypothetical protein
VNLAHRTLLPRRRSWQARSVESKAGCRTGGRAPVTCRREPRTRLILERYYLGFYLLCSPNHEHISPTHGGSSPTHGDWLSVAKWTSAEPRW